MRTVAWLTIAPVKSLGLVDRDELVLGEWGVEDDRRFYLIDDDGRKLNGKVCGELVQVLPDWNAETEFLSLRFPDGAEVGGTIALGDPVTTDFYGSPVEGRLVEGPWAQALSEFAGRTARLVRAERRIGGVDRGRSGSVTMLSTASLDALGGVLGETDPVDPRRFRMLLGIEGAEVHEEDSWLGRDVSVGEAVVRPLGNVGRCAVTTQNPETGVPDLGTLKALHAYRENGTEPLPFGVHGVVVRPGRVRVGDPVEVLPA